MALRGDDTASGLAELDYQIDGSGWQRYIGEFTLATPGEHRIGYRAVDYSGRLGVTQTLTVAIDLTAPLIQLALPAQMVNGVADLGDYITVQDTDSGVAAITILRNSVLYQPGQALPPGAYTLQIEAANRAELRAQQLHTFVIGGVTYLPLVVQTNQ